MDLVIICKGIQNSYIGTYIRESNWFPIIEGAQVLGLSVSVGLLLVSDLRLMGVMLRKRPRVQVAAPAYDSADLFPMVPEIWPEGRKQSLEC